MENNVTQSENLDVKSLLDAARNNNVAASSTPVDNDEETHIVGQNWAAGLNGEEVGGYTKHDTTAFVPTQEATEDLEVQEEVEAVTEEVPVVNAPVEEQGEEIKEVRRITRDTIQSNGGLVLNNSEIKAAEEVPAIGDLGPALQGRVDDYLNDMDSEINELKSFKDSIFEALEEKGVDTSDKYKVKAAKLALLKAGVNIKDPEAIKSSSVDLSNISTAGINEGNINDTEVEERYEKYNEAVVLIDKIGMGQAINFSEQEKEKLRKVNVIKLKEVEEVSLEQIKIKRPKKDTRAQDILKKGRNPFSTNIAAVASGYTATIRGGSSYEIIALLKEASDQVLDTEAKWQLIYDKIETMSCGKPDSFTDWLKMTAASDFNTFLYGILVATYPDDDTITFTCNTADCKKEKYEFNWNYSVRGLLRAERMSDVMKERFSKTIDNSYSVSLSKAYAENESPMSITRRVKLPYSEMIVELQIQSAYDLIYKSIADLGKDEVDKKYAEIAVLSTSVARILVPDMESGLDEYGNYEYFELLDALEVVEALYTLQDKDLVILNSLVSEIYSDISFDFGLMNIECPKCHKVTPYHPMEVESILFRKLQQAAALEVE